MISLSKTDVIKLQTVIHKKEASKSIIRRCQILLEWNENNPRYLTQMRIGNSFGVCKATVSRFLQNTVMINIMKRSGTPTDLSLFSIRIEGTIIFFIPRRLGYTGNS
jgi:hypothetical protein